MGVNKKYILLAVISVVFLVLSLFFVRQVNKRPDPILKSEASIQKKLVNTPDQVKAIYFSSASGGNDKKINRLIELALQTELNSVVLDIKDSSGHISYVSSLPGFEMYKTEKSEIKDLSSLVSQLHDNNIYVIARMAVFEDPILANARPDLAVKNKFTGGLWYDRNGLAWIDPANREAWKYFSALAKDALTQGVDEINIDYVRFPSDGSLETMVFPAWDRNFTRSQILNDFFKFFRSELGDAKISSDLFGFVTTRLDDFGVGQVIEDAFQYFDYISPMVYPSHYPNGFLGYPNPAVKPYEVVNYAMRGANNRLNDYYNKTGDHRPHLRPWLQDFDLGADYTPAMVEAQIKATQDVLGPNYHGFMLWNARNIYSESVFKSDQ